MQHLNTENILGYPVTTADVETCVTQILDWVEEGEATRSFVCANPHSIQVAKNDECFKRSLEEADLLTPDGIGIVFASRILGGSISDRVTGSDIFWGLSEGLNERQKGNYFFLGSTEEVLDKIQMKMAQDFPSIKVAGTCSPPYKPKFSQSDSEKMIEAVNSAKPDVLWVGMTAPKQEKWIYENKDKLDVRFIGAIGAVFDFYVGNVKRSHPVFQRMGLEWLPRLVQEPRRLWRRNFVSNPAFMARVMAAKLSQMG